MIGFGETLAVLVTVIVPVLLVGYIVKRWFAFKEKELEANSLLAAEKSAQYANQTNELEQRVRVLEQIVTDGGAQTAAQIEALRDRPAIASGDKIQ
jgi:hypothetical protein